MATRKEVLEILWVQQWLTPVPVILHGCFVCLITGDVLSGYSSTRLGDDLGTYDGHPRIVVDEQYYVEPSPRDLYWPSVQPTVLDFTISLSWSLADYTNVVNRTIRRLIVTTAAFNHLLYRLVTDNLYCRSTASWFVKDNFLSQGFLNMTVSGATCWTCYIGYWLAHTGYMNITQNHTSFWDCKNMRCVRLTYLHSRAQ